jgi:heme/copper-type cytochrome/quinol oxidase subunit 2
MNTLWACAACYGQADSPMANGMNWGIFSLLAVVVGVLGSVAVFFVYLARRAAANPNPQSATTDCSSPVTTH